MTWLSVVFGAIVGLSLGLTGGGGAIFAVPLLVYGLGLTARDAVSVSIAAVGATSFVGFLHRRQLGEVEMRVGLLFAIAGMLGAPVGTWIANGIPEAILLLAFGGLIVIVALRLWHQAAKSAVPADTPLDSTEQAGPTCRRDATGGLVLNSRCARLLFVVGLLTGILSGLFGVGGGFIIVPALVIFSGMSMQRAIGTSMMVMALVSVSGVATRLWSGSAIDPRVTSLFIVGSLSGLFVGQRISRRLSVPTLQRVFVVAMLIVAIFVIARNLSHS